MFILEVSIDLSYYCLHKLRLIWMLDGLMEVHGILVCLGCVSNRIVHLLLLLWVHFWQ